MFFNVPLRFFLENYFEICMSSLINLHNIQYNHTATYIINDITCFFVFTVCAVLPILVLIVFFKFFEKIVKNDDMMKRLDTLYEALALSKASKFTAGIYLVVFMLKRLLFCFVIIELA